MDYDIKQQFIATAIQTTSDKSPLAVYMYLAKIRAYKLNFEPNMTTFRAKKLLLGIHPSDEEIDILSNFLELEPRDVRRLTFSKPSPKDYEIKHQYMISPSGAPFIVSDCRSNREMEGWVYITRNKAIALLEQHGVKPVYPLVVTENPVTKQATLKHGITRDTSFGWEVYGVK